jgi:hypothetical protein
MDCAHRGKVMQSAIDSFSGKLLSLNFTGMPRPNWTAGVVVPVELGLFCFG